MIEKRVRHKHLSHMRAWAQHVVEYEVAADGGASRRGWQCDSRDEQVANAAASRDEQVRMAVRRWSETLA